MKIPPGARTGTKVRVAAALDSGAGSQKGDLYLIIKVLDDPDYSRKGNHLYTEAKIDFYTAVLGGEVTVKTLSGSVVLTVPAGTQPGQTFRLTGRGMPKLRDPKSFGDLYVKANVNLPSKLSPKQRELFEKLADLK